MTNKWPTTAINEISDNLDSQRVPVSKLKRKSGDIPYYGATGIVDYVDDYIFNEELLLIGEDGADWSAGANTAFIINGKSWVNNHAHVLRIKDANIQFVMNYLNYTDLRNYITGTTRGKLNQASLNKIKVPNPPLKVQHKVADILSSVDDAIQKTDQIIQKTETLKNGLMNELLTKGIGHKKFKKTKLGEIPEEWEVKSLDTISLKIVGGGTPSRSIEDYWGGDILWATVKDLNEEEIILSDTQESITKKGLDNSAANVIPSGSIITSTRMGIGRFYKTTEDIAINQDLKGIILNTDMDTEFILWSLIQSKEKLMAKGTGTTVKGIKVDVLKNLLLPIPPLAEQKAIATQLIDIQEKIQLNKKLSIKLKLLKRGLMDDIFSQKININ